MAREETNHSLARRERRPCGVQPRSIFGSAALALAAHAVIMNLTDIHQTLNQESVGT